MAWRWGIVKTERAHVVSLGTAVSVPPGVSSWLRDARDGIFWQERGRHLQGNLVPVGASDVSFRTEPGQNAGSRRTKKSVEAVIFLANKR
jgi:hypothetical protein